MKSYSDFGIDIPSGRNSGKMKVTCPKCRDRRTNKRDKSFGTAIIVAGVELYTLVKGRMMPPRKNTADLPHAPSQLFHAN